MRRKHKIVDSDGVKVIPGCTIFFSYGIPPVGVVAPVIERDGELIAITKGHSPEEGKVSELMNLVGCFYVDTSSHKPARRIRSTPTP
jgi:hypothetical protein